MRARDKFKLHETVRPSAFGLERLGERPGKFDKDTLGVVSHFPKHDQLVGVAIGKQRPVYHMDFWEPAPIVPPAPQCGGIE